MSAAESLQERFSRFMFWPRSVLHLLYVLFCRRDQLADLGRIFITNPSRDMHETKALKDTFYLQSRHAIQ